MTYTGRAVLARAPKHSIECTCQKFSKSRGVLTLGSTPKPMPPCRASPLSLSITRLQAVEGRCETGYTDQGSRSSARHQSRWDIREGIILGGS